MTTFSKLTKITSQMGWRYVAFRLWYEFQLRTGLLRFQFPKNPAFRSWISLSDWKMNAPAFFFNSRDSFTINPVQLELLKEKAEKIKLGELQFFNGEWNKIPIHNWLTNASTGFVYSAEKHWTEIGDFDTSSGDIKYVWEKSRFGYFQTVLRYDAAFGQDSSHWVFDQIESWIESNPINQGPNYRCSQEISIRIFNWTLALYFYRNSTNLTEERFERIMFVIYWQLRHIRSNIHFSRIAVRNNHAISESLALYTAGLLFPFFEEAAQWKVDGKRWLEEEMLYQFYEDGSYLQFSFNYHRVGIQLLTWAFSLSQKHNEEFDARVYERAYRSLHLLTCCQDRISGGLSNYGANDGSLFFDWNDACYEDFSPALDALHFYLTGSDLYTKPFEDRTWFGLSGEVDPRFPHLQVEDGCYSFSNGGLYVYRQERFLILITCVSYKDRPSHADGLHLDLWHNGINLIRDSGSYQYNADPELMKYFFGTESHNTIMVENFDQMTKGSRFIWWDWVSASQAEWVDSMEEAVFSGSIRAFRNLGNVTHTRRISIHKKSLRILVEDTIHGAPGRKKRQLWHLHPEAMTRGVSIVSLSQQNGGINKRGAFYSPTYGVKEPIEQIEFVTTDDRMLTEISL